MDYFAHLPEGCISEILSLTSPEDTARLSATSKGFKAAAESDSVWNRFLPPDLTDIISRSASPVVYSNKKELYFTLCNSPILLDDGAKLSFSVDKRSGKKCFMIAARELNISWGNNRSYWVLKSHPDSRFSKVASLRSICRLDIRGKIGAQMLSETTNYAAYLVFRLVDNPYGSEPANAVVRFASRESVEEAEMRANRVILCGGQFKRRGFTREFGGGNRRQVCRERSDGWMEVEMGRFFVDGGVDDGDVEARLIETLDLNWKSGLIVEGIEFRPNLNW
ncbi:PREDICTED: putative F-box protein PP2-B12 isoform X1 [Ipomoea nil]|uniref:putative F-box protein PP2-B12 isoform X1 n=1 Tax=Ipomoea nil TaxID=35883 RepID=UPI000900D7B0|nr:PREDICTED: putative F-box protein PP2-B12 isoform X1 [Ipomoea nil]